MFQPVLDQDEEHQAFAKPMRPPSRWLSVAEIAKTFGCGIFSFKTEILGGLLI